MIYFNDLCDNFLFFFLSFASASKTTTAVQRRYRVTGVTVSSIRFLHFTFFYINYIIVLLYNIYLYILYFFIYIYLKKIQKTKNTPHDTHDTNDTVTPDTMTPWHPEKKWGSHNGTKSHYARKMTDDRRLPPNFQFSIQAGSCPILNYSLICQKNIVFLYFGILSEICPNNI